MSLRMEAFVRQRARDRRCANELDALGRKGVGLIVSAHKDEPREPVPRVPFNLYFPPVTGCGACDSASLPPNAARRPVKFNPPLGCVCVPEVGRREWAEL